MNGNRDYAAGISSCWEKTPMTGPVSDLKGAVPTTVISCPSNKSRNTAIFPAASLLVREQPELIMGGKDLGFPPRRLILATFRAAVRFPSYSHLPGPPPLSPRGPHPSQPVAVRDLDQTPGSDHFCGPGDLNCAGICV